MARNLAAGGRASELNALRSSSEGHVVRTDTPQVTAPVAEEPAGWLSVEELPGVAVSLHHLFADPELPDAAGCHAAVHRQHVGVLSTLSQKRSLDRAVPTCRRLAMANVRRPPPT